MNRSECTDAILEAKRQKGLSLQELADKIGPDCSEAVAALMWNRS